MQEILNQLYAQPDGDRIDQLVLACTHFPLLREEITAASPAGITLVDSGAGIARRTAFLTQGQDWPAEPPPGTAMFTRDDDDARLLEPALRGYGLTQTGIL